MRFLILLVACAPTMTAAPVKVFSSADAVRQGYREVRRISATDPQGRYDEMVRSLTEQAAAAGADAVVIESMTDAHGRFEAISARAVRLVGQAPKVEVEKPTPAEDACQAGKELCHLEKTCKRGFLPSCVALGSALQDGRDVKKNVERAADLFEEACFKGYALACTHYGYAFYQGLGRPPNDSEAIVLFKRACDAGNTAGCRYLGLVYLGTTVPVHARQFLRQACAGKDSWSCWRLAKLMESGEAGEKGTPTEVADLYQRACVLGAEEACYVEPSSQPLDSTAFVR